VRCCRATQTHKPPAPTKRTQLPLWDEMWWDDGQLHSQPVLDYVGEPTQFTPVGAALPLPRQQCACENGAKRLRCRNLASPADAHPLTPTPDWAAVLSFGTVQ